MVDPTWLRERQEVGVEVSERIRAELIKNASNRLLLALHVEPDRIKHELTSETIDAIDALSRCLESPVFSREELVALVAAIHPRPTIVETEHGPAYHYDYTQKVDH